MTTVYQTWVKSIGRDGPTYDAIKNAHGDELEEFENDLITNLGYYEVLLLSQMKSAKAIPALESAYSGKNYSLRDRAVFAKALLVIKEDFKYLVTIISFLQDIENTNWNDRQTAITLLTDVKHPDAFSALEKALYDPKYLVRSYAAFVYSHNSCRQTSDQTILNNTKSLDKKKLDKLARLLRNKIYT